MLWICRECANEVEANDLVLATTIGWTALDGDTGVCPVCSQPSRTGTMYPRAAAAAIRRARANHAIEVSRAMVARARQTRWDEPFVKGAAERLGFKRVPCLACQGTADSHCPNCEGEGAIWRSHLTTISRNGLIRLAMWPAARKE